MGSAFCHRGFISMALSVIMALSPVLAVENPAPTTENAPQSAKPPMPQEELDQILAPIALYPDVLLSQILMASTYPLEIVQADRWMQKNKDLSEDAQAEQLEQQDWDPSVKSLVNFPRVLDMMSEKLDWTIKLGDAFIGQQSEVMDTVQSLRGKAQAQGNLQSNDQQTVTVEAATVTSPQVIVIEPANPQVIYVPTYNPTIVFGTWWYPRYPPYYWYPPGYVAGVRMISFGVGFRVGMSWGYAWGRCNWRYRSVNVNINRNININNRYINRTRYQNDFNRNGGNWRHNPSHREGVAYRDRATAQQFGRGPSAQGERSRESFRGRTDAGQNIGNGANRPNQGGNRPNQDRPGQDRPSQGGNRGNQGTRRTPSSNGTRSGAFDDAGRSRDTRNNSNRGDASRGGSGSRGGAGRPAGGGGAGGGGGGGARR
jgi:uncharacterized membrane protein YgcG